MMTYGHVSGLHSNGLLIAAAVDYNLMCLDIRMLPDCAAIVYSAFGEKNSRALLWHSDQLNILKTGSSGGLVTTWQIT